ncbi:MAG: hypothetical protein MZV70_36060 [Desulfobacterales bacterium]|nr:hypothetical protein [Desulfobacterales bacterium]
MKRKTGWSATACLELAEHWTIALSGLVAPPVRSLRAARWPPATRSHPFRALPGRAISSLRCRSITRRRSSSSPPPLFHLRLPRPGEANGSCFPQKGDLQDLDRRHQDLLRQGGGAARSTSTCRSSGLAYVGMAVDHRRPDPLRPGEDLQEYLRPGHVPRRRPLGDLAAQHLLRPVSSWPLSPTSARSCSKPNRPMAEGIFTLTMRGIVTPLAGRDRRPQPEIIEETRRKSS